MFTDMQIREIENRRREQDLQALNDYRNGRGNAPLIYKAGGRLFRKTGESMVFVASEESPDRVGDVIVSSGWKLDNFQKNPVFMFCHDYSLMPIGTVPKVWVQGKQLLNMVKWDEEDELARHIKGKYERGVMKAESVGFRPLKFEPRVGGGMRFIEQELLEISAVPIPAHPAALTKIFGRLPFMRGFTVKPISSGDVVRQKIKDLIQGIDPKSELGRKLTYQLEMALEALSWANQEGKVEASRRLALAESITVEYKKFALRKIKEQLESLKINLATEPSYALQKLQFRELSDRLI